MFFRLSNVSMISVLCVAFVAPAFAASSVRSLGGTGTYVGTNSAAKTTGSSTRTSAGATTARVGALRVNPSSTRVTANSASLRTPSARSAATTQRLSLGKYLSGSSAISGGSSVKVDPEKSGLVSADEFNDVKDKFEEVRVDIEGLKNELQDLTGKEHINVYQEDNNVVIESDGAEPIIIPLIDEEAALVQLNNWLENNAYIKGLEDKIAQSGSVYEGTDDGFVKVEANKISIAGAIASSLRDATDTDGKKLVTVEQVTEYAIPKPTGCLGSTVCVLSYNDELDILEWLELVDDTDVDVNPGATDGNMGVDTYMGDELSNDDNASVDSESELTVSGDDIAYGDI